jgi:hypothetical protein
VKKYSEFINFPIYLWATKEVDVEVPADEEESNEEEDTSKLPVNYYSFFRIISSCAHVITNTSCYIL